MKKSFTLFILILVCGISSAQPNRIEINNQALFMSGMNMAWGSFSQDLTNFNEGTFTKALDEISAAGGNSMRWWMHVNGTASPQFTDGKVSGITQVEIDNVKRVLDLALERQMVISLCLWSFDMLQGNQGIDIDQNLNLLQNPEYTQAYIDNALIPMVNQLKGHPAIMCWEVFNEPEGMTTDFGNAWTPHSTEMKYVQQFINMIAGAIHKVAPDEKVSNGSWSFRASSDIGSLKNYYKDSELIQAGGDSLGTLDFYMVHYYDHFGTTASPFHHPASYWELDKPVVIGEFSAKGPYSGISPQQAYEYLYDNGYAGGLSWTWTGHDGHGDVNDAEAGMMSLKTNHPEDIIVNRVFRIADFSATPKSIEIGQNSVLTWKVYRTSSVTINGETVGPIGSMNVSPEVTTQYTLIAVDSLDASIMDTSEVTISVVDPNQINRALNKPVTASTFEACCGDPLVPEFAVDDDMGTRWSSAWQNDANGTDPNYDGKPDDQWFQIDMGESIDIEKVNLFWEAAYGKAYNFEVSFDSYVWETIFEERDSDGGADSALFTSIVSGRYIRMKGIERATEYGYSLWEMQVYGTVSSLQPPQIVLDTYAGNVLNSGSSAKVIAEITASSEIVGVAFSVNGVYVETDTEAPYEYIVELGDEEKYDITAVVEDSDGFLIQAAPFIIYPDNREFTRFEAESAIYTGEVNEISSSAVSGGKYLEMRSDWTLTLNNVEVEKDGSYLLSLGYQLTFESPKHQYLVVNSDTLTDLKFTASNTAHWLKKGIEVELNAGINVISIQGIWNWMSFDYIDVEGATIVGVEESDNLPISYELEQNFPNPFNPSTIINYSTPVSGEVLLEVYNIQGQLVNRIVNQYQSAGKYSVNFNASHLSSGVYFYRLNIGSFIETKKMMLVK